jgi:hypothetical protein
MFYLHPVLGLAFRPVCILVNYPKKVISEALGHSSVAFTMDTYSHIISGMQGDMMALLDEVLPSGVPASRERQNREVHD